MVIHNDIRLVTVMGVVCLIDCVVGQIGLQKLFHWVMDSKAEMAYQNQEKITWKANCAKWILRAV